MQVVSVQFLPYLVSQSSARNRFMYQMIVFVLERSMTSGSGCDEFVMDKIAAQWFGNQSWVQLFNLPDHIRAC